MTSTPSRSTSGPSFTEMTTNRSPLSPPWRPALPSPRTRSRLSLSTPGGTRMEIFLLAFTRPSPPHATHASFVCPAPLQLGQMAACWKVPMGVRTVLMTCPEPPQVEHARGLVPGFTPDPVHVAHLSIREMLISFSHPNTASRKSRRRSYRSSSPLARARPPRPPLPPPIPPSNPPPPPPKNDSKMSNGLLKSPMPAPPKPPPPKPALPFRPASPYRS